MFVECVSISCWQFGMLTFSKKRLLWAFDHLTLWLHALLHAKRNDVQTNKQLPYHRTSTQTMVRHGLYAAAASVNVGVVGPAAEAWAPPSNMSRVAVVARGADGESRPM